LVAMYNRMMHDRRNPEQNLVNNIDNRLSLTNVIEMCTPKFAQELANIPDSLKQAIGMQLKEAAVVADTKIPERSQESTVTNVLTSSLPNQEVLARLLGGVNYVHAHLRKITMRINKHARRTVVMEPKIGNKVQMERRRSGFAYQDKYGQCLRFLTFQNAGEVTSRLLIEVILYTVQPVHEYIGSDHEPGYARVCQQGCVTYLLPEDIGEPVVFAPWFSYKSRIPTPGVYAVLIVPKKP